MRMGLKGLSLNFPSITFKWRRNSDKKTRQGDPTSIQRYALSRIRVGDIVKTLAGKNDLKAGVVPSVFPWVRTSPRNRKEPTVRNMEISQNSENKPLHV